MADTQTQADIAKFISDADAQGKALLVQAGNAADALLSAAQSGSDKTVPQLEGDAVTVLLDFVPTAWRAEVQALAAPFISSAQAQLNPQISAAVAKGIAVAKARINAITGATG